jgi:AraC-like DNA-binding protein
LRSKAIVVYFNKEIFGQSFYLLNETQPLKQLFHKAERGMKITDSSNKDLLDLIRKMPSTNGLERITGLLKMLQYLSQTKEYDLLASIGYQNTYDTKDNHKIDEVFQYVSQNFFQDISLEDMARRCHLTPQSFCRFFKKRTQKTFIDFLNEFRVSHARRLLAERDEMTISEIAYECGFHNISNFNKIFKEKTNGTPRQYKKRVQEN